LHEEMVGFIVKAPLANNKVGTRILHALDHVSELFLFVLLQLLELFHTGDVELVLGLGTRRFEWTGENGEFSIADHAGHLRMGHVFVDQNTLDQFGVGERASNFSFDLDEIKRNIAPFQVGNSEDRVYSDLCEMGVLLRNAIEAIGA